MINWWLMKLLDVVHTRSVTGGHADEQKKELRKEVEYRDATNLKI